MSCLTRRLTSGAGGAGGCNPPAILASRIARAMVVQMGQGCREVKRDGTTGLVGCWIRMAAEGGTLTVLRRRS
jgi:hypothetical protein